MRFSVVLHNSSSIRKRIDLCIFPVTYIFLQFVSPLLAVVHRQQLILPLLLVQHHLQALEGQLLQLSRRRDLVGGKWLNEIKTEGKDKELEGKMKREKGSKLETYN